jgi:hypothetical protein
MIPGSGVRGQGSLAPMVKQVLGDVSLTFFAYLYHFIFFFFKYPDKNAVIMICVCIFFQDVSKKGRQPFSLLKLVSVVCADDNCAFNNYNNYKRFLCTRDFPKKKRTRGA